MRSRQRVNRRWTARRPGFTLIELLLVIVMVALVAGVVVPRITAYQSKRAASNARDAMIRMAAQARAAAIQAGTDVEMRIDPTTNRVTIVNEAGETLASADFQAGPIRANLAGTAAAGAAPSTQLFRVCYVPRGYARANCGSDQIPRLVTFVSPTGRDTARAWIRVSQAERQ